MCLLCVFAVEVCVGRTEEEGAKEAKEKGCAVGELNPDLILGRDES